MLTPEQNYFTDVEFRMLTDTLEQYIHRAQFTPSELREAAVLAAIHYELTHLRDQTLAKLPDKVQSAVDVLTDFRRTKP